MPSSPDLLVRRLRLRHLELLVVLDEVGTVRGTATRLHLSQPAVSKMLGEVERAFGARLFDRSPQGARPNALGLVAVQRARIVLHEVGRARDDVAIVAAGAASVLRLGTLSVTSAVPRAVAEFRRRMPGAAVRIREGRVRDLVRALLDGELDCVFGAVVPELLDADVMAELVTDVMQQDALAVLADDRHALARRRRLRWSDLQSSGWIAPPRDTLVRQAFMTAFLDQGLAPPEPAIEAVSSVTIGEALRLEPTLLAAVRLEHARAEVARGGVRQLAVAPTLALPSLGLFTRRSGIPPPPAVRAFAAALRSVSR